MKPSNIVFYLGLLTTFVSAQEEGEVIDDTDSPAGPRIANFGIEYSIEEHQDRDPSGFLELEYGENITLNFNFTNNEESDVTVVSVGGTIYDTYVGNPIANVTETNIGPFEVKINDTIQFNQIIDLEIQEGNYYLIPAVYVLNGSEVMKVGTKPTLLRTNPLPISFLNPKFLFVQLVIFTVVGVSSYFFMSSRAQRTPKTLKRAVPNKQPTDMSWLPDIHKN